MNVCRTWYQKGVGSAVELALKTGYRLVDCAFVYLNEAEVGETLQKCFKNGVARREDIFITSKLWYYNTNQEHVLLIYSTH